MSDGWLVVTMCFAAVLGQYLLRRLLRRGETEQGPVATSPVYEAVFDSPEMLTEMLRQHAREVTGWAVPEQSRPLHRSIMEFLERYESLPLYDVVYYSRALSVQPYSENPEFVQIGEWGDGSPILVRRSLNDPKVYIDDIEECVPGEPQTFASGVEAYLRAAFETSQEAEDIARRWQGGPGPRDPGKR